MIYLLTYLNFHQSQRLSNKAIEITSPCLSLHSKSYFPLNY